MILRICNVPVEKVTDGGSSRDLALIQLTEQVGGTVLYVQDDFYYKSKFHRLLRFPQLIAQVMRSPHQIVLLYYPGYPFFWKHKVTVWFLVSVVFTITLYLATRLTGKQTIVDVVDLPLYQYQDLLLPMEMGERTFHAFDYILFTLADEVWFASRAFAELARLEYRLDPKRVKTVLNGAFRVPSSNFTLEERTTSFSPLRFVYAGSMNAARELDAMLAAFSNLDTDDIELHLCGIEGEWIVKHYPDSRIKYHGHLNQADTLKLIQQCDVGIVPYPERGYYNLVFPSKLPLYIIGGVMVLTSDATELAQRIEEWQIGIHAPLSQIKKLMQHCINTPEDIIRYRKAVHVWQEQFYWDTIYYQALSDARL